MSTLPLLGRLLRRRADGAARTRGVRLRADRLGLAVGNRAIR